jgi:hypothetical protein
VVLILQLKIKTPIPAIIERIPTGMKKSLGPVIAKNVTEV